MVRDEIAARNPGLTVEIQIIKTTGDRRQEWAHAGQAGDGKGIFVKEIDDALVEGRVDAAVHSLKDLPTEIAPGLLIAAIPLREDPRDVVASPAGLSFEALPSGSRVGTGSPRRVSQLRHARRDLIFVAIRGNVETRLRKMRQGDLDAVVLAAAGLKRLGLMDRTCSLLPVKLCLPAVGQGALAIEARDEEGWVRTALAHLHDPPTAACVTAERAFLRALGGGCQLPIAALATLEGETVTLRGVVCDPEGEVVIRVEASRRVGEAAALGAEAASRAIDAGAAELLASVEKPAGE